MKKTDKVTVEDLRAIPMGGSETYELSGVPAIYSARALASRTGNIDGVRFETTADVEAKTLTITKVMR